jgi:hypothetical protein
MGTPHEDTYPNVTHMPNWNDAFPVWPALDLRHWVPSLGAEGVDLLMVGEVSFVFNVP